MPRIARGEIAGGIYHIINRGNMRMQVFPRSHVVRGNAYEGGMMKRTVALLVLSTVLVAAEPEVIHGHQLPPEPDPVINDSTLLGIDVNKNGVRDDVEIWILNKYRDKHPIHIDIAMQGARGFKLILEHAEKAKEIHYKATAYIDCESYYSNYAKYFNEPLLVTEEVSTEYYRKKIYFNTEKRKTRYIEYDKLLSGDSYTLPKIENLKSLCDFNTSKYEE